MIALGKSKIILCPWSQNGDPYDPNIYSEPEESPARELSLADVAKGIGTMATDLKTKKREKDARPAVASHVVKSKPKVRAR